jgi:pimeloyl-ACP methyl ester carboxylesterase
MKKRTRFIIIVSSTLISMTLTLIGLFVFLSRALIYMPVPYNRQAAAAALAADRKVSELFLDTDGIRLHGLAVRNSASSEAPWAIFFGGQSGSAFNYLRHFKRFAGCNFVMFDYRGYGLSGGAPSEGNLFKDAETEYDYVKTRLAGPKKKIFAMGFSLGSGVAVFLASARTVDGLVLAAPYDSIRSVAADRFPEFILTLFLKEDYDSLSRIGSLRCPVLVFASEDDRVIPFRHTRALLEKANDPKTLVLVPGAAHNDIVSSDLFVRKSTAFMR